MSRPKKNRRRRASSFKFETFLINYGLQIAGALLLTGGLVYFLSSNYNPHFLAEILNSFKKPSQEKSFVVTTTATSLPGYLSLLLLFPGILLLISPHFLRVINPGLKNILVSLGFIWLISSEAKILLDVRSHSIELNYYLILASFFTIQIIATTISIAGKNRFALNWSVISFFISVFLIRLIYGVIFPNIIFLIFLQVAVSLFCFKYNWKSPFILLMTLSSVYISYYFLKLVIVAGDSQQASHFMLPGLLIWFVLSAAGFGILKPGSGRKIITAIWGFLPYGTLFIVLALSLGFYYQSGVNFLGLLYYLLALIALIIITVLNRKYSFIIHGDPFYISLCIFSAFLLPQLFYVNFFLVLSASLAVTLLINVLLTDLKISFHFSMGMFFVTLGLYLVDWAFTIIPALIDQKNAGTIYPMRIVLGSLLVFAFSYYYNRLFTRLLGDYSFSHTQTKSYNNSVRSVYYTIMYLTGFLIFDYTLINIIPGYRVNLIEWGFYTYTFLYFLTASQNSRSKTKLRYVILFSLLAVFLYPAVIHPEAIHFRTLYLAGNSSALTPFVMHYFCLGIMVLFILQANRRLILIYPNSRFITNARMLLGIVFLCFILLSEYDHVILLFMNRFGSQPAYEILQYNKFIPYSVILLSVSIALLVFSIINYTRFLRRLSMFMILAVLLKVLFVDIMILSVNTSIILLISLGAILIAFSFLIPGIRKQSTVNKSS